MFGNNKKEQKSSSMASTPALTNSLNSIVQGTFLEGNIKCESDIRIDGTLQGSLECSGKVIIGSQGHIEGNINCENALVEGFFEGILIVKDTLNVQEHAVIKGDIKTEKLVVHSGASFNVSCNMGATVETPSFSGNGSKKETLSFVEELPSDTE